MIRSFRDKRTAAIFLGLIPRKLARDVAERAHVKLIMVDAAARLEDLRVPPSNRLEALKGDRQGQHSIRVTDQWRICFVWRDGDAHEVQFTDYH